MINRARSATEAGRSANRFRYERFGAAYGFFDGHATREECSDSGRISASGAVRVPCFDARGAILREDAVAEENVDRLAFEMPALDQNRAGPEFRDALRGFPHLRGSRDGHTSQFRSLEEIRGHQGG